MELQPDTLFHDRYRLVEEKGRGSYGEVWLARDEQLEIDVAIKVYIALDDRGIEEFKSEFKTSWQLNHPNLLHAYHFDLDGRRPYLVMPYCPGQSTSLIGTADEAEIWRFIRDVSAGLAYLHERDIVHHDIKPDNILVGESGVYQISDFGISTRMRSTLRRNSTRKMNNSLGGSLPYMGPELFSDMPDAVKASDIWAMGVMLFEIITGELPFFGQGGGLQLHGAAIPVIVASVSQELKATVAACMAEKTWDRPTARQLCDYAQSRLDGADAPCPWDALRSEKNGGSDRTRRTVEFSEPTAQPAAAAVSANGGGKRLNWFVCVYIWLVIVANLAGAVVSSAVICQEHHAGLTRLIAISCILSSLGGWMMWCRVLWGYWAFLAGSLLALLARADGVEQSVAFVFGWFIGILVPFAILQIRRDGVSAWKVMDYGWRTPRVKVACAIAACLALLVAILPDGLANEARQSLGHYRDMADRCAAKTSDGSQSNPQALIEALQLLDEIEEYEDRYGSINGAYDRSEALRAPLRTKAAAAAAGWSAAAESQSRVGNSEKALEFYGTALQLDERSEYRSKFEAEARKVGFVKPLGLEFRAEGEYGETLRASEIKYLYTRLKYDAWDMSQSHDVELKVKIYENGSLSSGTSSGSGYTFKKTVTVSPEKGGYLYLPGWGNERVGSYSRGTVRVEVWCGSKRLVSESVQIQE